MVLAVFAWKKSHKGFSQSAQRKNFGGLCGEKRVSRKVRKGIRKVRRGKILEDFVWLEIKKGFTQSAQRNSQSAQRKNLSGLCVEYLSKSLRSLREKKVKKGFHAKCAKEFAKCAEKKS